MKFLSVSQVCVVVMLSMTITACQLPENQATKESAIEVKTDTWLARPESQNKLQQGLTAYLALDDAFMSIASRLYLIRKAQHHLDLQYYIWKDDYIGHLMLSELLKAADRGVKVRLLIDDQNGIQLDETLKKLALHPNFEIRLFNPYKYRKLRVIDYSFRLKYINHRMHNKLIIADGIAAVTGGRNISREYFDASESFQFTDLDIFFLGQAVQQANRSFLTFWNDQLSYSVEQILGKNTSNASEELAQLRKSYRASHPSDEHVQEKIEQAQKQIENHLQQRPIAWAKATFLSDHPAKIRGEASDEQLIYNQIFKKMGQPQRSMELVSAYFVPSVKGTQYLSNLSQNKVKVRVLTNSLRANDVALVHAFYQKYRVNLLRNGVELYEFKPYIERNNRNWYEIMTGNVIPAKGKNTSSLHAKFFDVDNKVFIGSFNFDPRSAKLNTEVGLVVESETLKKEISNTLDKHLNQVAYRLKLDSDGKIIWMEHRKDGTIQKHFYDPETTQFQRFVMHSVSYLPIEWMM